MNCVVKRMAWDILQREFSQTCHSWIKLWNLAVIIRQKSWHQNNKALLEHICPGIVCPVAFLT